MTSDLCLSHGKMAYIISFPVFEFSLVIKLRDFDFESPWIFVVFLLKKKSFRFEYVQPNSAWSGLRFVVSVEFWQ